MPSIKRALHNCSEGLLSLTDLLKCLIQSVPSDTSAQDIDLIISKFIENTKRGRVGNDDVENLLLILMYGKDNIPGVAELLETTNHKKYIKKKAKELLHSEHMFRYFTTETDEEGAAVEIEYFKSMSLDVEDSIGRVTIFYAALQKNVSSHDPSEIFRRVGIGRKVCRLRC